MVKDLRLKVRTDHGQLENHSNGQPPFPPVKKKFQPIYQTTNDTNIHESIQALEYQRRSRSSFVFIREIRGQKMIRSHATPHEIAIPLTSYSCRNVTKSQPIYQTTNDTNIHESIQTLEYQRRNRSSFVFIREIRGQKMKKIAGHH